MGRNFVTLPLDFYRKPILMLTYTPPEMRAAPPTREKPWILLLLAFAWLWPGVFSHDLWKPDEIWFTQKDMGGATKMYSLSDFNISNTATVENDYLNGRYGGIPFLSNLKELNWHTNDIPNQK